MTKKLSTQPVRAVILHGAVGALGEDDELHTSPEMQGLTAAWMPGDHSLCLIIGGGQSGERQLEPALTVVVPPESTQRLAQTFARPFSRTAFEWSRNPAPGIVIGLGAPARPPNIHRLVWGGMALVVTSRAEPTSTAFPGRTYVLQIKIDQGVLGVGPVTHRFCVYLTADEVDDLKVVLKYVPSWFVGE